MGIFSIFHSRDKPVNRTAGSGFSFYMGGSSAGKTVTERSAMQMTAVYACVRILSEAIAGLPLHLYKYTDDGGKEKAVDHPLYLLIATLSKQENLLTEFDNWLWLSTVENVTVKSDGTLVFKFYYGAEIEG